MGTGEEPGEAPGPGRWPYEAGERFVAAAMPGLGDVRWLREAWDRPDACPWHVEHPGAWRAPGVRDSVVEDVEAAWRHAAESAEALRGDDGAWTVLVGNTLRGPWAQGARAGVVRELGVTGAWVELHVWHDPEALANAWPTWTESDICARLADATEVAPTKLAVLDRMESGTVRSWSVHRPWSVASGRTFGLSPIEREVQRHGTEAEPQAPTWQVVLARAGRYVVVGAVPRLALAPTLRRALENTARDLVALPRPAPAVPGDVELAMLELVRASAGEATIAAAPVRKALAHSVSQVRCAALELIGLHAERLPPVAGDLVAPVVDACGARDFQERILALRALATLDPTAARGRAAADGHPLALSSQAFANSSRQWARRRCQRSREVQAELILGVAEVVEPSGDGGRSLENTLDNARRPGPARTRLLAELQTCTPTRMAHPVACVLPVDGRIPAEARAIGRLARSGLLGAAARDALSKLSLPSASRRRLASELLVDPASRRAGLDAPRDGGIPPIELLPILEAWRKRRTTPRPAWRPCSSTAAEAPRQRPRAPKTGFVSDGRGWTRRRRPG
ncbi:MAG: hypothetical protein R3F05_19765 [Planctomycetota bacterium]